MSNQEREIAKAFIYHTGSTECTQEALKKFKSAFAALQDFDTGILANIIQANINDAYEEINPVMDMDALYKCIAAADKELLNFKRIAGGIRSAELDELIDAYPLSDTNKRKIKAAKSLFESDSTIVRSAADLPPAPADDAATAPEAAPAELPAPINEETEAPTAEGDLSALDPKMKEKVMLTLNDYLAKTVFQSKAIPELTLKVAKKLGSGKKIIVDFELKSYDGKITALSSALIDGKAIIMPQEFFDENWSKLGDFTPEALTDHFSIKAEESQVKPEEGYNNMVSAMLNPNTPRVVRSQILDMILKHYGRDNALKAFELYTTVLFKTADKPINTSPLHKTTLREE